MSQAKKCPECGAPILPDAPKGYCPACLVKLGAEGLFPADLLQTPEPAEKATRWPAGSNGAAYPTLFGDYELLGEIGRGGMGVVYKARQKSLNRIVAVKLMLSSGQLAQPEVVQRFRTEAQAIAHLQHPNIVAIHEVGEHDGQHYFSMEYVEGRTLAEMVRDGPLAATRAATYLKTISEAVHYAHAHGILHRDLKPSNVLIDSSDQPHITDFGLAKRLENSHLSTFNPQLTLSGQVLGSPNYLSPEQAAGRQTEVGPASDVYALGAMLYHLLTGRPPFQGDSLTALLRQVMETDPIGPRLLNPGIPRDLEMICLKCLEKDRSRRYETANGLALDIERHLGHEPVLARPQSRVYRLGKLIRRNKLVFTSGAAVFAALALGTLVSTWEALRANDARRRAERGEEKAKQNELAARVAETNALRQAYSASLWSACDALDHAQIAAARHYLESAPPDFRGWEWRLLSSRLDLSARVHEHPRSEHAQVHVLPDGRSYYDVCAEPTNCIQRWDIETGQLLATIPMGHPCWQSWLVAGGKQLIAYIVEENRPKAVEVWDLEALRPVSSQPVSAWPEVAPDGSQIAYEWEQKLHIVDIKSGITRVSPTTIIDTSARRDFTEWGGPVMSWQPGGRRLAVCSSVVEVALLDTDSLEVLSTFKAHKNLVFSMAFSADSRWLATGSMDNTIRVTDIAAKPAAAVATMRGHAGWVRTLRFSPDGSLLASWCKEDRTLRLWDTRTGNLKGVFESDGADVSFLPDGQTLISGDVRAVHLWDVRSAEGWVLRGHRGFDISVLVSPDGGTIYSGGWDGWSGQPGSLRFWDAATGDQIAAMGAADVYVRGATLSLDGSRLAVSFRSSKGMRIEVLDTATGTAMASVQAAWDNDGALAFDPAGQNLVWFTHLQGVANIADIRTGLIRRSRQIFGGASFTQSCLAWSPDGATIAVNNGHDPTLEILDAQSLEPVRHWPHGHSAPVCSVAFSPDSRRILTVSEDGIVRVWDALTGHRLHDLVGHGNQVLCAVYSPDGKRIASGGRDNNVRIWDAETFAQMARLGGHEDYVFSLAWRADSQQLISSSGDYTVRIWDTQSLKDRMQARRDRQVILARVEPMVQRLFSELGDASKVVERVKAEGSLSKRARQIALQVVLRTSVDQQKASAQ